MSLLYQKTTLVFSMTMMLMANGVTRAYLTLTVSPVLAIEEDYEIF